MYYKNVNVRNCIVEICYNTVNIRNYIVTIYNNTVNVKNSTDTEMHTCKKREIVEIYLRKFFWIFRKILG